MGREPSRIVTAITAAITATIGVLTLTGAISPEVGGAISAALGAWLVAAGEVIRSRVTPTGQVALTVDQADQLTGQV